MKALVYLSILAAVLLYPVKGRDVGKLIPVEVVAVSESDGRITVVADTGDRGWGRTLEEALAEMKAKAAGYIYLDTAEYLILETGMDKIPALREYLKGNVKVCHGREGIPLEGIADYLSAHEPRMRLEEVGGDREIPEILEQNGKYELIAK